MNWYVFFWIIGVVVAAYWIYSLIKQKPEWFTGAVVLKTMNTLGGLALGLIVFISICVLLLKSS